MSTEAHRAFESAPEDSSSAAGGLGWTGKRGLSARVSKMQVLLSAPLGRAPRRESGFAKWLCGKATSERAFFGHGGNFSALFATDSAVVLQKASRGPRNRAFGFLREKQFLELELEFSVPR